MTYLARIEPQDPQPAFFPEVAPATPAEPDFSSLEWSVIRLARIDRLWTVRDASPVRRFWNKLIGRGNPSLANARLEALRRMAVLNWHFGFTVPGDDVADFLSAGFTPDQYELMASSINAALTAPRKIPA